MSDTRTRQPSADSKESAGHGRHRGPIAAQESETTPTPRGRHRKPVQETVEAAF
ncbi:hypothetical protein [Streptomyces dangxiongensis]|uniref:hypothetical protein n=1 Tax=Streptomyces dangxiongensis TaxID=1442032 RepID=UPI0013CEC3B9|nr:hypothetical protein [Streptomyces dangxiongensis]